MKKLFIFLLVFFTFSNVASEGTYTKVSSAKPKF